MIQQNITRKTNIFQLFYFILKTIFINFAINICKIWENCYHYILLSSYVPGKMK